MILTLDQIEAFEDIIESIAALEARLNAPD